MIGLGLGDARRDRADAHFAHQFHRYARCRIGVLQIVNELRQILDGINIVMRRRGDQPDARRRVADLADVFIDLVAGKLPAFARLGALGHLDLQLVGVDEIFGGHAKPRRGDLLDGAAAAVAVGIALESVGVFAPFAGVALPADAVHRDRQVLVRLPC